MRHKRLRIGLWLLFSPIFLAAMIGGTLIWLLCNLIGFVTEGECVVSIREALFDFLPKEWRGRFTRKEGANE